MSVLRFSYTDAGMITDGRPDRADDEVEKIIIRSNGEPMSANISGEDRKNLDKWALSEGFYIQAIGSESDHGELRTYAKIIRCEGKAPELAA